MWVSFSIAFFAVTAALIVPGLLIVRALAAPAPLAPSFAPGASLALYVGWGMALSAAGWRGSGAVPLACALATALALTGIAAVIRARRRVGTLPDGPGASTLPVRSRRRAMAMPVIYVACGLAVAVFCWLSVMDGADSFSRSVDNVSHLSYIRVMVENGSYSVLHVSPFADRAGSFYPAAWHVVGAMLASVLGTGPVIMENALDLAYAAVVFPLGCLALIASVSPHRGEVAAGSLVCVSFTAFPWMFLTYGILCSNLAGDALVPAAVALGVRLSDPELRRGERAGAAALFAASMASVAAAQPNAVFAVMVIGGPCVVWRASLPSRAAGAHAGGTQTSPLVRFARAAAATAVFAALWALALKAPFMQGVLAVRWPPVIEPSQLPWHLATLAYRDAPAQPVLAALVAMGLVRAATRPPQRWFCISYLLALSIHGVSVSTDGTLKVALAGFWYSDSYRTAALAAIAAVPLAAIGLAWCRSLIAALARRLFRGPAALPAIASACATLCLAFGILYPGRPVTSSLEARTGFGFLRARAAADYDMGGDGAMDASSGRKLDRRSVAFLARARAVIGSARVLNLPFDGSAFAYGAAGLNVYYRSLQPYYGAADEAADSRLFRERGLSFRDDPEVAERLRSAGVRYLLVLDYDRHGPSPVYSFTYDPAQWAGLAGASDGSPGLSVVLSEGDMRLYRLEGVF